VVKEEQGEEINGAATTTEQQQTIPAACHRRPNGNR
jgi:hypothetical protein